MSGRTLLPWAAAVVVAGASIAAFARTAPGVDGTTYVALAAAFAVMFGVIYLALWANRTARETRARLVTALDRAMRAVAAQTGDSYSAGGFYEHPMIERIDYPGRLSGARGSLKYAVCFEEDEGYELVLRVTPVAAKKGRLTPRTATLSPRARAQLQTLLQTSDRVCIEGSASTTAQADGRELLAGAVRSIDRLLTPEALVAWIDMTVTLAGEL